MTAVRCLEAENALRSQILTEARSWIGTPYIHQASYKGGGCDCLGLIRGVWRSVYGNEPEATPAYSASWSEVSKAETLIEAAARHLDPLGPDLARAGDVLIFRMREDAPAKHIAILARDGAAQQTIIHAYSGHSVCESTLTGAWRRRIACAFRFPIKTGAQ